jgi:hypothetical protein
MLRAPEAYWSALLRSCLDPWRESLFTDRNRCVNIPDASPDFFGNKTAPMTVFVERAAVHAARNLIGERKQGSAF